jgi:hypothetical protein
MKELKCLYCARLWLYLPCGSAVFFFIHNGEVVSPGSINLTVIRLFAQVRTLYAIHIHD